MIIIIYSLFFTKVCPRDSQFRSALNIALEAKDERILALLANKAVAALESAKSELAVRDRDSPRQRRTRTPSLPLIGISPSPIKLRQKEKERESLQKQLLKSTEIYESTKSPERNINSPFHSHVPRNPLMSTLMKVSHFRTIWNIFVAIYVIAFVNTLVQNYFQTGIAVDLSLWWWAYGRFHVALGVWCCIFLVALCAWPVQKLMANDLLPQTLGMVVYVFLQVVLWMGITTTQLHLRFPLATAIFVLCEMARFSMKMHSYMMVNSELRMCKENGLFPDDVSVKEFPQNVTFGRYFYYLWAPTLIYQTEYPQTEKIRWRYCIK